MSAEPRHALYYWPFIPGRGEFVRLLFEAAGEPYDDVGRRDEREGGGVPAIVRFLEGEADGTRPFAPPFLVDGDLVIAHAAHICGYLGPRLGLVPDDEVSRAAALQHQLTVTDLVMEIHDTHHPLATGWYYEEQQEAAKQRAGYFLERRMPKFLGYFEDLLAANEAGDGRRLIGDDLTYPDLAVFQVLEGLDYAFPKAFGRLFEDLPRLRALCEAVREHPGIAAYLASDRRMAFNEHGIFRRYPELDT
ncbi:MAG: glutathione S-transferase [Myxococcota bacterium]